ncbi:hypothetical protein [Natrinema sp. SYSU A 869]|uniref:hypothetical protein n=1 Tax=Natrinema sp. SYSU A 869 TaxID=2871694 RepID=UPI001CA39C36|nr:hypothetical protein [Natrinema sp. SYSU A 869]
MGNFDPVSWETSEAALGPPASEVTEMVNQLQGEVHDKDPYDAVKTIHDALYDDDVDRTVPNLGEPFITAYLLEKNEIISPRDDDTGSEYRSIVTRRPTGERLRELFWERERTLWWIGILTGVHPSLVTYWFYEYDIPLMERNYTEESMEQIRAHREARDG